MSPTQGYSQLISSFKQSFYFQQIVYQYGSGQPTAQALKYISYWPVIAIFMASCLVLLATGPYSNQSYTILHLLSMRTQNFNFLLSHINTIVFYTAPDETLGYIEVIQSSSLYKDQAIVLHLNMSYVINYMLQFKELSRFPPSYRVPDLLSVPLFARNRVDVQESSLFSLYTKGVFCSLRVGSVTYSQNYLILFLRIWQHWSHSLFSYDPQYCVGLLLSPTRSPLYAFRISCRLWRQS